LLYLKMKKILFIVIITLFSSIAFSQVQKINFKVKNKLQFEYSITNYNNNVLSDTLLKFEKYNNKIFKYEKNEAKKIILKTNFIINKADSLEKLFLIIPPTEYVCNFYLNNILIYQRGNLNEGYSNRTHFSSSVYIENHFINYSETNTLRVELYALDNETSQFLEITITNRKSAESYVFWRNFFNIYMFQAIAFSSLIIALYFFVLYFFRKTSKLEYYLWFALSNIAFFFTYCNNFFSYNFSNNVLLEKMSRIGFPFWGCFVIIFFLEYSNILKNKKFWKYFFLISYTAFSIPILTFDTVFEILNYYKTVTNYPIAYGTVFYYTISIMYLFKKRDFISFLFFVFYTFAIVTVLYESYLFFVLMKKPYVLTLPYSIFIFDIVIFFVLSYEQSKVYKLAVEKTNELTKLTSELENIVSNRTLELKNTVEKLNVEIKIREQSEKELSENNAMKDKFFSIIAHDLINPIGALKNLIYLLPKQINQTNNQEYNNTVLFLEKTVGNTQKFLTGLLEWSRSQLNKIHIKIENINFYNLIDSNIQIVANQAKQKNIEICNNVSQNLNLNSDRYILNTTILNILTNAIKFSFNNNKILIESSENINFTEIKITDFGIGISPENLNILFKPDRKFRMKGTDNESGNGLGLLICIDFINKIEGNLLVTSQINKGSTFVIQLKNNK